MSQTQSQQFKRLQAQSMNANQYEIGGSGVCIDPRYVSVPTKKSAIKALRALQLPRDRMLVSPIFEGFMQKIERGGKEQVISAKLDLLEKELVEGGFPPALGRNAMNVRAMMFLPKSKIYPLAQAHDCQTPVDEQWEAAPAYKA